jgi:hypothetical protein
MAKDPQIERHKQWLGYLQPQGLVVAPAALNDCQAWLSESVVVEQRLLDARMTRKPVTPTESQRGLTLTQFCVDLLGWDRADLVPGADTGIESVLADYHETLRPDYAVRDPEPADPASPWTLLVQELPHGTDPDQLAELQDDRQWRASPQARFERLLRESEVPAGILFFGTGVRLVYAPKGESSGHVTFPFGPMVEVSGRPILAALLLLLGRDRMFTLGRAQRLPALLEKSRKYQNQVSTELAEQVLAGLHALLRGFQEAHAQSGERLLQEWLTSAERREDVYGGLLTVMLRLIFLLYAEDRGLLGNDAAWRDGYSVLGLFERLRSDADRFPDTMEQRFGAWPQLLATFRLVFDGCRHGKLQLPPRNGYLFHPDGNEGACYQFLEGRPCGEARQVGEVVHPPRVSDKVVWEVLRNLMVLDGERISYRTLNVEQIGSVYETMMGFRFERTVGPSLAIKPAKPHGAPAVVNLRELLAEKPAARAKWLKDHADCPLTGAAEQALKAANAPEEVALALGKKVSKLTPSVLPAGSFVLQPSDARRKSGSHYTPPQLTRPIVATTLRPVLEQLGDKPTAEQVLELKVCDPAMGSGAFLVEVCRQLGARVVKAWIDHPASKPAIPPDEDELLYAKRLVAQRCLYGVDKNPFAVALAKLSLWLETFAREHAFTFVDHALRCGDALVGLSKAQIAAFHWDVSQRGAFVETLLKKKLKEVEAARAKIREAGETVRESTLRRWHREAEDALDDVRLVGDLVVAAYFGGTKDKEREARRQGLAAQVEAWLRAGGGASAEKDVLRREVTELHAGAKGSKPFHWEVEYPEVFVRSGFDGCVGNPPFLGGTKVSSNLGEAYRDWLLGIHCESHGNADIVAHFLRRSFSLLKNHGALGLVATNTIAQGDTRYSGLRWICKHSGMIYSASRRTPWPGMAAVVVSVVHVVRGCVVECTLDGRKVQHINAYLLAGGSDDDPAISRANAGKSFTGSKIYGQGFLFDDADGDATPLVDMERLIATAPKCQERIFPYLGGEEVNDSPTHRHHRFVVNFGEMGESEARNGWPELLRIVEEKVRPARAHLTTNAIGRKRASAWWQYGSSARELYDAIRGMRRVLACCLHQPHWCVTFIPSQVVFSHALCIFAMFHDGAFAVLQSRPHEIWARFCGSSLGDTLRYTPTACFETYPFPHNWEADARLEAAGKAYYDFRAVLMVRNGEGLTKTYNRFHDPSENSPDIHKLRGLHAAMDCAVLDAYGWTDLQPTHEFLLDYEEEYADDDAIESTRRRHKPWRYRWPDAFRDEVLARLLKLNQERAAEEQLHSPLPKANAPTGKKRGRPRKGDATPSLFGDKERDDGSA